MSTSSIFSPSLLIPKFSGLSLIFLPKDFKIKTFNFKKFSCLNPEVSSLAFLFHKKQVNPVTQSGKKASFRGNVLELDMVCSTEKMKSKFKSKCYLIKIMRIKGRPCGIGRRRFGNRGNFKRGDSVDETGRSRGGSGSANQQGWGSKRRKKCANLNRKNVLHVQHMISVLHTQLFFVSYVLKKQIFLYWPSAIK